MKKPDSITIGIIIFTLVILGGIALVALTTQNKLITKYTAVDQDRPKLEIGETSFDFGQMKVDDIKVQEIPLKNAGTKPLIISDIYTSCDCTYAEVVIGGATSARFSMNRNMTWQGEIPAGQSATLKIFYEPRIMPVKGVVRRQIYFRTNDPEKLSNDISFQALVE